MAAPRGGRRRRQADLQGNLSNSYRGGMQETPGPAPDRPQTPRHASPAPPVGPGGDHHAPPADGVVVEQVAADLSAVVGRLMRRLRTALPDSRLTPSQRSVLARLSSEGPATTAALARAEYVRPQSMRLTLGALEEQGFIGRSPDPGDGRQSVVSLTDSGRDTLEAVRAARHDWLWAALTEQYDAAELRTLAEATALLERLVGR